MHCVSKKIRATVSGTDQLDHQPRQSGVAAALPLYLQLAPAQTFFLLVPSVSRLNTERLGALAKLESFEEVLRPCQRHCVRSSPG